MKKAPKACVVIVWKSLPTDTDRRVLLLKMREDRGGHWQPVTGGVEEGETFNDAALREAQEETGLSFQRLPQFMGLEYEFEGRWGPAIERAFLLPVVGGDEPPTPTIDPKEHTAFEWVTPAEALARIPFANNRLAVERATQIYPPIFLSRGGAFYQDGEEISHERTAELLHVSLVKDGESYLARIGGEEIDVVVEDTPRFVRSYDRTTGLMNLSDGRQEKLRPESLLLRPDNSVVAILENDWEALFLSPAYYELAQDIEEGSNPGEYVLNFLGSRQRLGIAN
ncbi:MAG: NUDIX domain-containing protein [Proteobacteria bacterium]|nr:MAG: NUDIX domain-containing protein [Pseudomonadota bacterium]